MQEAIAVVIAMAVAVQAGPQKFDGASVVPFYGYDDCIELKNDTTRVVLCPAAGGRVLVYSRNGTNALYLPPGDEGFVWQPGGKRGAMNAGRFDIGPEQLVPRRDALWMGRWHGEVIGDRRARLTSVKHATTGVQLVREFELAPRSTRLRVSQTIKNISAVPQEYCHWSRTFAVGGGVVIVPTSRRSRFPNHYVMYESRSTLNFRPEDDRVVRRTTHLEITGAPQFPKLGMDTREGWFAYLMPSDLMFVKSYPVDESRTYNEVAGLTTSIWYPDNGRMVELEPIGPAEKLDPGSAGTFTETWWLLPHSFPGERPADFRSVAQSVREAVADEKDSAAGVSPAVDAPE